MSDRSDAAEVGGGQDESMKALLEANRMHKGMCTTAPSTGEDRLEALQRQLDDLRKVNLKVMRVSEIAHAHALRPRRPDEDW